MLPTEPPDTSALVFRQPLAAGCATAEAVYVFSDGGGMGRFDGERWALVDPALRSISSAICTRDRAFAVGAAGRVVTVSDRELSVRVDTVQIDDLFGVSTLPDGVLAVGARGTVLRQAASWQPYAQGITDDLFGVAAFTGSSAWAVGAGGITYLLDGLAWRPVPSGVTATLRAVAGTGPGATVAVGDGGTVLVHTSRWSNVPSPTTGTLRAVAVVGDERWAVGDGGTVLRIRQPASGPTATPVDIGTTCTLRAVFVRTSFSPPRGDASAHEIWFVGSDGTRAGVWRRAGDRLDRWGTC